jgi:hypothetical protein
MYFETKLAGFGRPTTVREKLPGRSCSYTTPGRYSLCFAKFYKATSDNPLGSLKNEAALLQPVRVSDELTTSLEAAVLFIFRPCLQSYKDFDAAYSIWCVSISGPGLALIALHIPAFLLSTCSGVHL